MLRAATWPISRRKVRTQRPSTHHSLVCTVSAPNPLAGDAAEAAPRMIRPASALRALVPLTDSNLRRAKAGSTLPLISRNSALLGRGRPYYQMDTCGKDEITTLTTRACHSSAETRELANKSCVPCNSKDLHPMSEDSARKLLEQVNSWELTTEGGILKLHRAWKVKNFVKGLEFFQLVAAIAEEEGHHPDLHLVGWNNVKVDIWTHSVRGLTENDFVLAAKINRLNLEGLVSKKKAKVQE